MRKADQNDGPVISALHARANFGRLLRQVEKQGGSWVIERRGTPKAVLLGVREYVRLAAPEPEILRIIGEKSQRNGTDRLTSRQIDRAIQASRAQERKHR